MKVKIKINKAGINKVKKDVEISLIETAEAVKTDIIQMQVMPFDTGNMQNDSTFVDDKNAKKGVVKIVTDTPYARKVYFDPDIYTHTRKNPNARQHWFDDHMYGEKKDFARKAFAKLMRKRNGGKNAKIK